NHMRWMMSAYPLDASDVVLARTTISFDAAAWEIWLPLACGAVLCLADETETREPGALSTLLREKGVTVAQFVPSLLGLLLEAGAFRDLAGLRHVFIGGEPLSAALVQRLGAQWKGDPVNLYGPTEATIQITAWRCRPQERDRTPPIGSPIWNTQLYLLDG